ncbi:uncharacterized protein LOC110984682 [Acanthaster planci]|uniref:Uncharacterized protein LOC110984682 n=1 Tax=Acanthaster planci TaxID=133434 RepID=A0A8B7Z573_ACAPL|nr:uncharacterized protein LOC110984682 [Acanthaster planci]
MGIILGIEAIVGIIEGAEAAAAAAEAGEAVAGAAEAGEAISAGAEAGAEAGTEAGTEAGEAVASGGEALSQILAKISVAMEKISKLVAEYEAINAVFKAADAILKDITSNPAARALAKKLANLIGVLVTCSSLMQDLYSWLKENANDTTTLQGFQVPLSGILSTFLPSLGAASGVLQSLSKQVAAENLRKDPVTSGEVEAIQKGLDTVAQSFQSLVTFKDQKASTVKALASMPIDNTQVAAITNQLAAA